MICCVYAPVVESWVFSCQFFVTMVVMVMMFFPYHVTFLAGIFECNDFTCHVSVMTMLVHAQIALILLMSISESSTRPKACKMILHAKCGERHIPERLFMHVFVYFVGSLRRVF